MFIIRFLKKAATFIFVAALFCGAFVIYQGYDMYSQGLKRMSLDEMKTEIESKPVYTRLNELPETYRDAVVAVEDKRFYKHPGVDPIAIARAVVNDIKAGSLVQGGSTITQQLAKNVYFDQEKHFARKIAEVFMAVKMEQRFSKNEILELYLNSIYFGNGYHSVGEASRGYFAKAPSQLNEDECIMLAGIPNAPSVYNPVDNPGLAAKRQQQVRAQMIKAGYLTENKSNSTTALQLNRQAGADTTPVIDLARTTVQTTATPLTTGTAHAPAANPNADPSATDNLGAAEFFFTKGCDFLSAINPDWKFLQDFYKYVKQLANCAS